ncbi:MAG: recombinase family protein [Lachnospiraceae bacterium]|nr:recombinase family protein [Butyrivibrio sp.]MCM1343982.1 recombinase family protein [Muribaculaceae bacterium]MCM1411464.1 recombinase family protein [Lachnospiraceae bacterium]
MRISDQKYYAGAYKRLSREDETAALGARNESNSISNQRDLIRKFTESHPEIEIVKEYADDGFSGVDFGRPGFLQMLEDIQAGIINCVIVKDLSRFGRNYIEVGKYLEEIFPVHGVRFISISENYDSARMNGGNEQLVIPFMNLVNDAYCRDISIKTRTSLEMKQQKGEYVGSFAPYGYRKAPDDNHRFLVDEEAAAVVKRIFELTIGGMSNGNIANLLNKEGVPSPTEYKRLHGENFICHFQKNRKAMWSAFVIRRILENKVYLGVMEQGKTYSINYKVKARRKREPGQWYCVENRHEPIVAKDTFELVQKILANDLRTSPGKENVYLFSGIVVCGRCGEKLLRCKKTIKGNEYIYYGCYDRKKTLRCKGVCIRESKLEQAVTQTIRQHIASVIHMVELLDQMKSIPLKEQELKSIDLLVSEQEKEIQRISKLKLKLYEDYRDRFISWQEYRDFETIYRRREKDAEQKKEELQKKKEQFLQGNTALQRWLEEFSLHGNIEHLNRSLFVTLVERVKVFSANEIEVQFRYKDEFDMAISQDERKQG